MVENGNFVITFELASLFVVFFRESDSALTHTYQCVFNHSFTVLLIAISAYPTTIAVIYIRIAVILERERETGGGRGREH